MKKLIITDVLMFGWQKTKANYGKIFTVLLFLLLFAISDHFLKHVMENTLDVWSKSLFVFTDIGLAILGVVISINVFRQGLVITRGGEGNIGRIFADPQIFWKYIFGQILAAIIIFAGFILLIIPGIILALRLFFIKPLIVDLKLSPIQAVKKAFDMTRGSTWDLFLFTLAILIINIAGALLLIVGLLVTIPVSFFAIMRAYDLFLSAHKGSNSSENNA